MGSLASRPKIPRATTQIIYVPSPYTQPTSPTQPSGSGGAGGSDTANPKTDETIAADVRTGSLLSRDRSRFGTVSTSFRGLLDLAGTSGKRKTLLGE